MKKRIIICGAILLFLANTMLNMNMVQSNKAGNISIDAIAVMAQANEEIDGGELQGVTVYGSSPKNAVGASATEKAIVFYFNGQMWTNEKKNYNNLPFTRRWKPHKEPCSGSPTQNTNKTSLNMSFGIAIPGFPVELRSNYGYTSEQTTYYDEYREYRVICVDGDGNCFNGTPCKRG